MIAAPKVFPLEVFTGQDYYVPAFQILIQGEKARVENHDVLSVTYRDDLNEIDSFDMSVTNWDAETLAFKYSDIDTFNPGKDVELWMGYHKDGQAKLRRMLIGEITTMAPNFPSGGGPTLTIRGLNLFHRFRTKQMTQAFVDKKDTEIADILVKDIAKKINESIPPNSRAPRIELELDPQDVTDNAKDGELPIRYLLVNNQYPIRFLMERARRIGYELSLEEVPQGNSRKVTFHFRPTKGIQNPTYILEWGKSLISFQPTLQMANQVSEVIVRGWDPTGKIKFEEKATRAELAAEGVVNPSDLGISEASLAQKVEIMVDRPIQSKAEAKELAKKTLRQIGEVMVEADGKTIGLPDLRAGVKVQINGLGARFSGREGKPFSYLITSTTHTISDSGYVTDFHARMERPI